MKRALWIILGSTLAGIGLAMIVGGIYTSIVLMLVGGIVDIINQIKASQTDALIIAWAIVKIIFCEMPSVFGFWFGLLFIRYGLAVVFYRSKY